MRRTDDDDDRRDDSRAGRECVWVSVSESVSLGVELAESGEGRLHVSEDDGTRTFEFPRGIDALRALVLIAHEEGAGVDLDAFRERRTN